MKAHGPTVARMSLFYGDGLDSCYVNRPMTFWIRARDAAGENVHIGGDSYAVKLRGPIDFKASVRDCEDGTYEVTVTVPVSGDYSVHVTLRSKHITGSPFQLTVSSGAAHAPLCRFLARVSSQQPTAPPHATSPTTLSTLPLPLPTVTAGEEVTLLLESRDASGRHLSHGGDHFKAWLRPANDAGPAALSAASCARAGLRPPSLELSDLRNGVYALRCTVHVAGSYLLEVHTGRDAPGGGSPAASQRARPIGGSPLPVNVRPAAAHALSTTVHGTDLAGNRAGEDATFKLVTHDAFGNVCTSGGAKFEFSVSPPSASVPGWTPGTALDLEREVSCSLLDNGDGTYECRFNVQRAGVCTVSIAMDGVSIGDPIRIMVFPAQTHPGHCTLRQWDSRSPQRPGLPTSPSRALPPLQLGVGEAASLLLEAHDAFGNQRSTGGDEWDVSVFGPAAADSQVLDRADGSYEVTVAFHVAGRYALTFSLVMWGQKDDRSSSRESPRRELFVVPHSTVYVDVTAGPISAACSIRWPSPPLGLVAGTPLQLALLASDPWGNPLSSLGGAVALLERLRDPDEMEDVAEWLPCTLEHGASIQPAEAPAGETSASSGSELHLRAYPTRAGSYLPLLTVDGRPFRPSAPSYPIEVLAAAPSSDRSYARGGGLVGGLVGQVASFNIFLSDAYGNRLFGCVDAVRVEAAGCAVTLVEAADDASIVHASFVPRRSGSHSIRVFVGHIELSDSPFLFLAGAGPSESLRHSAAGRLMLRHVMQHWLRVVRQRQLERVIERTVPHGSPRQITHRGALIQQESAIGRAICASSIARAQRTRMRTPASSYTPRTPGATLSTSFSSAGSGCSCSSSLSLHHRAPAGRGRGRGRGGLASGRASPAPRDWRDVLADTRPLAIE